MANTTGTYKTVVNVDLPDHGFGAVYFTLRSDVALTAVDELFPVQTQYSLTLASDGTGTIQLPTPDNSGTSAWSWKVSMPSGPSKSFTLAYNASDQELTTLLAAEASSTTADAVTALISGKAGKVASATAGNLAGLDADGDLTDSAVPASAVTVAIARFAINANISTSATSLVTKTAPSEDLTGAWILIDPYTTEAELRRVTSVSGSTINWSGGTSYAHAAGDAVMVLAAPRVSAYWYGARCDGTTDDSTAITRLFANLMTVGGGTLDLPGNASIPNLSAAISITQPTVVVGLSGPSVCKFTGGGDAGDPAQLFDVRASFEVRGVGFNTWGKKVISCQLASTATVAALRVIDCAFTDITEDAIHDLRSSGGVRFALVRGCDFSNVQYGVRLADVNLNDVVVSDCSFITVTRTAVQLGQNTESAEDTMQRLTVRNCTMKDVTSGTADDVHGILVYGRYANIVGNYLENVESSTGADSEYIYTKARWANITHNVCHVTGNGHGQEAVIMLKGVKRGGSGSPHGYASFVAFNHVHYDTGLTVNTNMRAIRSANDDSTIAYNIIENCPGQALRVNGGKNNRITGNRIINSTGPVGIIMANTDDNVEIDHNLIYGLSYTSSNPCYGISITEGAANLSIHHNQFLTMACSSGHCFGIGFNNSTATANDGVNIHGNIYRDFTAGGGMDAHAITFTGGTTDPTNVRIYDEDWTNLAIGLNAWGTSANYHAFNLENHRARPTTFADGDATPSVLNWDNGMFIVDGSTAITNFDDGFDGQHIYVRGNGSVTLANGANLKPRTGANITPTANEMVHLIRLNSIWYEV